MGTKNNRAAREVSRRERCGRCGKWLHTDAKRARPELAGEELASLRFCSLSCLGWAALDTPTGKLRVSTYEEADRLTAKEARRIVAP